MQTLSEETTINAARITIIIETAIDVKVSATQMVNDRKAIFVAVEISVTVENTMETGAIKTTIEDRTTIVYTMRKTVPSGASLQTQQVEMRHATDRRQ